MNPHPSKAQDGDNSLHRPMSDSEIKFEKVNHPIRKVKSMGYFNR